MPFLDSVSLFLSFAIATLLGCMLLALFRLSASLGFRTQSASSHTPSHITTLNLNNALRRRSTLKPQASPYYRYLGTRTHLPTSDSRTLPPTTMFITAVKKHTAATPAPAPPPASKQQLLANSFTQAHTHAAPKSAQSTAVGARTLSTLSGNAGKYIAAVPERSTPGRGVHGIKRTSSGLAKALSQEDSFDYTSINSSDWENELPVTMSGQASWAPQDAVFFDESDFDSEINLDVEDPATRATVQYPTLPTIATTPSRGAAYTKSPVKLKSSQLAPKSSPPIPWSSSPPEHFVPLPQVQQAAPEKTKRRTLPWLQKSQPSQVPVKKEAHSDEENDTTRPRKRRSTEATSDMNSTPLPTKVKSEYLWDTTQSAIKEQQKNLREANKLAVKANKGTDDDVNAAIEKKKKNTVHRIFLSEEQTQVLNLVTEYKKSVFFTGSAGECCRKIIEFPC
jgi:ATP-dependent DNA helicase PIF1